MKEKLLPCPFCGSEVAISTISSGPTPGTLAVKILCRKCDACMNYVMATDSMEIASDKAIKAWNTRSCYPAEFIEWAVINYQYSERKNRWIKRYVPPDRKENQLTTKELYKIWKNENI